MALVEAQEKSMQEFQRLEDHFHRLPLPTHYHSNRLPKDHHLPNRHNHHPVLPLRRQEGLAVPGNQIFRCRQEFLIF